MIIHGNSLEVLKTLDDNSVDAIVSDPPYELGFMNKKWDNTGIAYNVELWTDCLRVLKQYIYHRRYVTSQRVLENTTIYKIANRNYYKYEF